MTKERNDLRTYFNPLTPADKRRLSRRLDEYRDQLEAQGFDVALAEGENGLFAGVLVIDNDQGRFGFLEEDGSINWLGGDQGIGALGSAIAQNPTGELNQNIEALENVDIE